MLDCVFHISTRFIYYFSCVLYFMAIGNQKKIHPGVCGDWGVRVCWTGMVGWVKQTSVLLRFILQIYFVINIIGKFCVHTLVEKELLFQYLHFFPIPTLSLTCSKLKSIKLLLVQYLINMESADHCPLYTKFIRF